MRLKKRLVAVGIFIVQLAMLVSPAKVKAEEKTVDEYNPNGSGIVWSEEYVDGWKLDWISISFFDTLVSASKDNMDIEYTYDVNGLRTAKQANDAVTYFTYDSDKKLISETTGNGTIEYVYSYMAGSGRNYLSGFCYGGSFYEYIYENGIITGIIFEGNQIVKYLYEDDIFVQTMGIGSNGEWVDVTSDSSFIGNINPMRFTQCYYDRETGWYYVGRYYSAELGRFIDGISPEQAEDLSGSYPEYELMTKTFTSGSNIKNSMYRSANITEGQAISRVIRLESPLYTDDQDCVAWVIKNRMNDSAFPSTAYGVISQTNEDGEKQFSTFEDSEYENFIGDSADEAWVHANYLTYCLLSGSMPAKPSGYGDQLYFSSVNSFLDYTEVQGDVFIKNTVTFCNCWIIPIGAVNAGNVGQLEPYRGGGYNVFCTKQFN